MSTIDTSKPVLVTGATGYVAGWLVKRLLEEGLNVHAAVRNPERTDKVAHLNAVAAQAPGNITYFKADLLEPGAYDEAMQGCQVVFHTASPFISDVKDPQTDLIEPAVNGTANVLASANQTPSVERVVVTSSCAAMYTDAIDMQAIPGGMITEEIWNTTASMDYQPYSLSKTLAEKKAWEMAEAQAQWKLVVINPCFVMGPPLNPNTKTSESMNILKQFGDGTLKAGAPRLGIGVVDVRDVAEAHFRAGFRPEAQGRYITCGTNTNFLEMGLTLGAKFGDSFPLPSRAIPKWLLMLVGPMANKAFTRPFIRGNVDVEWKADNSKIKRELGMEFRPLQETMEDGFQALVDAGVLNGK